MQNPLDTLDSQAITAVKAILAHAEHNAVDTHETVILMMHEIIAAPVSARRTVWNKQRQIDRAMERLGITY